MTILGLDPAANASEEALAAFLNDCRDAAVLAGRPRLVSISVEVGELDPLAVLESIFEPGERHFYLERPSERWAVAGAESALAFETGGPGRFGACQRFIDGVLADALGVGGSDLSFGGPHFFCAFSFEETPGGGEPFPGASVFVPRWQVGSRGGKTTAVANLLIGPTSEVGPLATRVFRAHARFGSFDFRGPVSSVGPRPARSVRELGAAGSYARAVAQATRLIGLGHFEKIVLARAKEVEATGSLHPLQLLNGLRQEFPDCTAFSVANGLGQSFIGASPERLLRVDGRLLTTEALAGSAGRGASASEDARLGAALLASEKDLSEHRIVLDSILAGLSQAGLAPAAAQKPSLRRLQNVQHLHTAIEAKVPSSVRILEILGRLHPTPAVGGHPRDKALPLIGELEGFARGLYGGALGWVDAQGGGEFVVGLRSALVDGDRARLYAGAGVVAGSQPEAEFAETELKFHAMQDALLG